MMRRWPFRWLLALLSLLATLTLAGRSVWQQEQIIARGQLLYLALAPRDPRSLLQGDYMALNYVQPLTLLDAGGAPTDLPPPVHPVTSYFFPESQGARFEAARYAVYRRTEDGRFALVALAGEDFVALDRFRAPIRR